jgi:DNA-binding MarR family transcriptional regulator
MAKRENTFSVEQPNDSSGFLLWKVTAVWQKEIKETLDEKYQLTHSQYVLLASIHWLTLHGAHVTQIMLSEHTKIEPMNISKTLQSLIGKEFINRQTSTKDSRAKQIILTKKGKDLIKKAVVTVETIDKNFFKILGNKTKEFNKNLLLLLDEK